MEEITRVMLLKRATYCMVKLGFQANQRGYRYLREAVVMVCQDGEVFNSVTKILYPKVAKKFRTTDKQVERAIRNTIETAWEKGNIENINQTFGVSVKNGSHRPTNSEVIEVLTDKVLIEVLEKTA